MNKYFLLFASAAVLAACGGTKCSEHQMNAKEPILFEYDSVKIVPESQAKLDDGLLFLTGHRFVTIQLDGWADEQGGNSERNMDLSKRRAEAVRDYMVSRGVAEKRITTKWHGIDLGKPYNEHRRVEVTLK